MSSYRTLIALLFILGLVLSSSAWSRPLSYDKYDDRIEKSVKRYWVRFGPWYWWKAQLYQESLFDPDAVSPVGAQGLAQFMPGTWEQITRELGWTGISARHAGPAIDAGAYYMAKLHRGWSSPRPDADRHFLAAASYNAGFGNLLQAQRACDMRTEYNDIIRCLPQVTGRHSEETITYVKRIKQWAAWVRVKIKW